MQFADGLHLTDLWRLTHPEGREYTRPPQLVIENRLYPSERPHLATTPKDINLILEKFYESLYGPDPINESTAFLNKVPLPIIDDKLLTQLNAPLSLEEFTHTIKSLSPGKAPVPDGYTSDLYKLPIQTITPTLMLVYQKLLDGNQYLPLGLQAHTQTHPKKG